MDITEQFEKRSELDKINHEISSLNKKYKTNIDKDGTTAVTNHTDGAKLLGILKRKQELEKELEEDEGL